MVAIMSWMLLFFLVISLIALSKHVYGFSEDSTSISFINSMVGLLTMQTEALGISEKGSSSGFVDVFYSLSLTFTCIFVVCYFVNSVMISLLADGHRFVMIQSQQKDNIFEESIDFVCFCCYGSRFRERQKKICKKKFKSIRRGFWHILIWLSDWLPERALNYVIRKASSVDIEDIDEEIKQIDEMISRQDRAYKNTLSS